MSFLPDSGRLSHAYLICAASRAEGLEAARTVAAAAVCSGLRPPCGQCRDCRKVAAGIHPDVITVSRETDDKGREKREIGVEQIRRLSLDAAVLPNEAERKVYIIDQADAMNLPAQNASLKLLEEPPRGVVFLLCAANPALLLPTVRSRCVEIKLNGQAEDGSGESAALAQAYLKAVASGDAALLFRWCAANEQLDSRAAAAFIDAAGLQAADMLCARREALGLSEARLLALCGLLERCSGYLRANTGVKHIFGLLAVDSIPAAETEDN